jgi:hypothetical protein
MLAAAESVRLLLWVGKVLPLPMPDWMTRSVKRVEVTQDADGPGGFQITFAIGRDLVPVEYTHLASLMLTPMTRVVIGVLVGAVPQILVDGVITRHDLQPSADPGTSTLTVTGRDLTQVMDLVERQISYANQPAFVMVEQILARYAVYGLVPAVAPTTDMPLVVDRTPWQCRETDLACIERLANESSYVFYLRPISLGVNLAYFGPDVRTGVPMPALTFNMGPASNVTSISFSQDGLLPLTVTGTLLEDVGGLALPLPGLPPVYVPPMALLPTLPYRTKILRDQAKNDVAQSLLDAQALLTTGRDSVTAQGEVDTVRYGWPLQARSVVGVRGAGYSYDGLYWIKSVTHNIERGKYTQSFSLAREGTGALLPVVVP